MYQAEPPLVRLTRVPFEVFQGAVTDPAVMRHVFPLKTAGRVPDTLTVASRPHGSVPGNPYVRRELLGLRTPQKKMMDWMKAVGIWWGRQA